MQRRVHKMHKSNAHTIEELGKLAKEADDPLRRRLYLDEILERDPKNHVALELRTQPFPKSKPIVTDRPTQPNLKLQNSGFRLEKKTEQDLPEKLNRWVTPAIASIIVAVIAYILAPIIIKFINGFTSPIPENAPLETHLSIKVVNDKVEAVQGAKVMFTTDQDLYPQFSDINGNASMNVFYKKKESRIFVETKQYAVYDQIVSLPLNGWLDVRLSPRDPNNRNVILRISDSQNGLPVEGAEITLIVADKTYGQPTDSYGITKFLLQFGDKDELDADISVKTREYERKHLRITLHAEHLQDILIDPQGISVVAFPYLSTATPVLPNPTLTPIPSLSNLPPPTPLPIVLIKLATVVVIATPISTTIPSLTTAPIWPTNVATITPSNPTPVDTPTITPIPTPSGASLGIPGNGSTVVGSGLTFNWNSNPNAVEYYLDYTGPSTGNSGWTTSLSFAANGLPAGTYTWHVKARNLGGEGPWSELWTVNLQPPADVWVHVQGTGFEFTGTSGTGGWVEIRSQNTINKSIDLNVIYTQTRAIGATNDADWARWRPTIITSGYYRVCIFAPWYTNSMGITNQARYTIHHANGNSTPPENPTRQSDFSNSWMNMGRYQFNAGTEGNVYMGDYTGDNPIRLISADAAKFIWSPIGTETCQ
jgi:hypothetical protein